MAFVSAAQRELLTARLLPIIQPPDGGLTARKIAGAICDWLEFDAIPELLVNPGIPLQAGPYPGATIGPGIIK